MIKSIKTSIFEMKEDYQFSKTYCDDVLKWVVQGFQKWLASVQFFPIYQEMDPIFAFFEPTAFVTWFDQ